MHCRVESAIDENEICPELSKQSHSISGLKNQSYGETPVLMHSKSTLGLLDDLSFFHQNWFKVLSKKKGWTEYSLYFQYLEKYNLINNLYIKAGRSTVLDLDSSVWFLPKAYQRKVFFTPDYILSKDKSHGYFVAIQSYLDERKWLPKNIPNMGTFYTMLEETIYNKN